MTRWEMQILSFRVAEGGDNTGEEEGNGVER